MLPLGQIISKYDIQCHCYADDTQLYVPLKPNRTYVKQEARNLGVVFDLCLYFNAQVTKVVWTCFLQVRLISKVRPFLSFSDLEKVIHTFITSRLDYCNTLYSGISKGNIHRLQLIQNAAVRLLTRSRRSDHIAPILAGLHWLPVCFRIDFKILLLVFKTLHGQAPIYIGDLLNPYEPDHCLRSSGGNLLTVPVSHLVTKGDWAFAVRAPKLWNSLSEEFRLAKSVSSFKLLLKTFFYIIRPFLKLLCGLLWLLNVCSFI
ncbi:hypothetical protein LDENG_00259890 [Lucifuga dentata]|nr:hypothetical protein LDENG_00259890 [Lucifuga dentata]